MTNLETSDQPDFPDYELERQLGQGGMGEVWLARDLALDRRVALKVLRRELLGDRTAQERFQRESRTVARLRHPGIIQIFAVGEHEERLFFSMEYVDGLSLRELLDKEGFLSVERSMDILEQVASALALAHSENVIHRDIKPSNILIDSLDRVTVTDFGLAKIHEHPTLTDVNAVLGTPGYLAPESLKGADGSVAADIYAFGVTAYECFTGRKPTWDDQNQLVQAHEVLGHIPIPLSKIISRCLAHESKNRFKQVSEITDELKKFRNRVQETTVEMQKQDDLNPDSLWQKHQFLWMTSICAFAFFMLVKSIYIDSYLALPESEEDLVYFTLEQRADISDEMKELMSQTGMTSFGLGLFSIAFAFWFCSLVQCLSVEEKSYKKVFSDKVGIDKGVWLLIFIVLNVVGALIWKVVNIKANKEGLS